VYERLKSAHPVWFEEVEKRGSEYDVVLADFLSGMPPYIIKKYEKQTDATMTRFMLFAAIAMFNNKYAKNHNHAASVDYNFNDPVQIVVYPEKGKWKEEELHHDPRLYKIHLMPRDIDLIGFYDNLVKLILENDDLRKDICYFKVLPNEQEILKDKGLPRIVLYIFSKSKGDAGIRESKEKAQHVLDRFYAEFKDVPGSGLVPRYNEKVTDLIFFAQGNRADRLLSDIESEFDEREGMVYFMPGYHLQGEPAGTVDFHLKNPATTRK
jgi:hypothetical protein